MKFTSKFGSLLFPLIFLSGCITVSDIKQTSVANKNNKTQTNITFKTVEKPIKALIITGRSNKFHNWQASSTAIEKHLNKAGIFEVTKYVASPGGQSLENFAPQWHQYDVVVSDYEGDEWPENTKTSFVEYIKNGGGLVVVHGANNSFPQWPEYNEIIGLGGWGSSNNHAPKFAPYDESKKQNRDERWGPRVYWHQGKVHYDHSKGQAYHPKKHQFIATIREHNHPITQGLPDSWLHNVDEIYTDLRGPAKNLSVLVTGIANPDYARASRYHEPILFTVKYGKGRIVQTTLGHAGRVDDHKVASLNDIAFVSLIQRSAEWAATNQVTLPIPDNFPNVYENSKLPDENAWQNLLDSELSQWQAFIGVPHETVKGIPKSYAKNQTPLGLNNDLKNIYTTYEKNGETILSITGEIYAGLTSKQEFSNYHFQTKMRWLDKKWEPRLDLKRDSGILYHCYGEHGAFWNVWKKSLEFQIQENDMGDFIAIGGTKVSLRAEKKGEDRPKYNDKAPFIKDFQGYAEVTVEPDKGHGQWNVLDLYVVGDKAIHVVNGKVVMVIKDAKNHLNMSLTKGQIQIQSEGAELEYKAMRIRPITEFPNLLKQKAKF